MSTRNDTPWCPEDDQGYWSTADLESYELDEGEDEIPQWLKDYQAYWSTADLECYEVEEEEYNEAIHG